MHGPWLFMHGTCRAWAWEGKVNRPTDPKFRPFCVIAQNGLGGAVSSKSGSTYATTNPRTRYLELFCYFLYKIGGFNPKTFVSAIILTQKVS